MKLQLLQLEYEDSVTLIKLADDIENQHKVAAETGPRSPLNSLPPSPMFEDRAMGRKAKRAEEEDGNVLPPKRKRRAVRPMALSPSVGPAGVSSVDRETESEESHAVSSGHEADQGFMGARRSTQEVVEGCAHHMSEEARPSVPRIPTKPVRRRYAPRKVKARAGYKLEDLNIPPLNPVSKVGKDMSIVAKLEHVLHELGGPADKVAIIRALETGWPDKQIDDRTQVSVHAPPEFTAQSDTGTHIEHYFLHFV